MELILIKDVENLGYADDIVQVKDGYGRNFLIPQGMALLASAGNKKAHLELLRQKSVKEKEVIQQAKIVASSIVDLDIKLRAKTSKDQTKLFGSISSLDLSKYLGRDGIEVDKKYISIEGGTVKTTGKFKAKARLHREVVVEFEFEVAPDNN